MRKYKRKTFNNAIEITPLIDLVFLLLIFFLVATTTTNIKAIKVNIPKAETGSKIKTNKIVIVVDKSNKIYIDNKKYTLNQLQEYLKTLKNIDVFQINGDKNSSYDTIIKIMDLIRKNGFNKITLGVNSY